MAEALQIHDPRERMLVRLADAALWPLGWRRRPTVATGQVGRVLLLRLERIGDLLMVLDAIGDARRAWPNAEIDLAVGSWNAPLAALIPGLHQVHIADVPWLAREGAGDTWRTLLSKARDWRGRRYDVVVNFEPDIRSNLLAWRTGAPVRAGYWTGGGRAFLTTAFAYDQGRHVSINARELIARASGSRSGQADIALTTPGARLSPPAEAIARASALIGGARGPLIGIHASGGRESKQWHLDRFALVARALVSTHGGTIVLTGSAGDRPMVDRVRRDLEGLDVIDAGGALDLPSLAALLQRLDVLVTGDTGPMHLAAAMATPVVALFGPSNPARYGPIGRGHHVLRIQLPCSPCGQVRLPPERCRGHVPDCLDGISVAVVVGAASEAIAARRQGARDR
jgi:heptosyltransferase-1